jgi:NAD(P)-dependent dehydrogenase (short-subunit alcohol dehydrogenase family)
VYSVSKTALLGLTKTAAKDLAPENIRVNCVAPGIVITKFSAAVSTLHCLLGIKPLYEILLLLRLGKTRSVLTFPQPTWARL